MNQIIFNVRNLSKSIGNTKILSNISFDMYKGEIVACLGHNGAGKTTTIRCMTGLLKPEGKLFYQGEEVDFSNNKDSEKIKKNRCLFRFSWLLRKSFGNKKSSDVFGFIWNGQF